MNQMICKQPRRGEFDCSGQNLNHVPSFPAYTTGIDLSGNNLSIINDSFKDLGRLEYLYLNDNIIETFQVSNVRDLRSLRTLDLSGNRLNNRSFLIQHNIRNACSLLEFRIHNNLYQSYPEEFISTMLSLRTLHLDVFEGFRFGRGFLTLHNLTDIQLHPRKRFQLRNDSFHGLRNTRIETLNIDFSYSVYHVEADIFSPFRHLRELTFNIGEVCNIQKALRALCGLRGRRMEYLNLANNFLDSAWPIQLTNKDIRYLKTMCIKRVDLRRCITRIPHSIADSRFADCLEEIRIGDNNFQESDIFPVLAMMSYRNIRVFGCSYAIIHDVSFGKHKHSAIYSDRMFNVTIPVADSLISVNLSALEEGIHKVISNIRVVGKKLKELDMAFTHWNLCNPSYHITFDTNIKYFDLSNWDCYSLNPNFFMSITTLETLIFSGAGLSEGLKGDLDGILLKGLFNLSALDLSGNSLSYIHNDLLSDQSLSLRNLTLRNNVFHQIPSTTRNARKLKLLDIQNNKLSTLSESDTYVLDE